MIQNTLIERAATPAGVGFVPFRFRWWRSCLAQPPANGWHPSGMSRTVQAGGLKAISRWLRSAATTLPVSSDETDCIPEGCQQRATFAARVDGQLKKMGAVWK